MEHQLAGTRAGAPAATFPDSAPSVEPVSRADSANPELDSLRAAALQDGSSELLLPGAHGSRPAPAAALLGSEPESALPGAANSSTDVPLVSGLRITSTLAFPDGDRDNVVVLSVSAAGVVYSWHLRQEKGGAAQEYDLRRFVRASDLAGAPRLNDVVGTDGPEETPGYTFVSLSRATYRTLRAAGEAPFVITGMDAGLLGGTLGSVGGNRVTYKGRFSVVSPTPEPIPILLDGRRRTLPALHLKGAFAFQDARQDGDYWVLADSAHPLILKEVSAKNVLQVIRIDRPTTASAVEATLASDCRAELPGIYFAFGSAVLDPASAPTLADVAAMLGRHADWTLAIEGHTDSIGAPAANLELSSQRAASVRAALVSRLGVPAARLTAAGFGATRPRESNATIEGRARNRRVELARRCGRGS